MERRLGDVEKPLTIEDIRGESSLRYERMNMKSSSNKEVEVFEENAFLVDSLKESAELWTNRAQVVPMQESRISQWWK
jgi:hypothetical protein